MSIRIAILCLLFTAFISCNQDGWYTSSVSIPDPWMYNDPVTFDFQVEHVDEVHEMLLRLRHDESFDYQNLYVKITTKFPDGKEVEDVVSLDMTDGKGYAGSCRGGDCEVEILLRSSFKFENSGAYTIAIEQYSREEALSGINAAELILRKKEK